MIQSKTYGLQNETRQYLRRLYAYGRELAPADVADIDNFVKGLKQLNLWQNIIDFWLLRSNQAIGAGSLALSFFGRYNGVLINSPTWGSSGVNFLSSNQSIDLGVGLGRIILGSRGIIEFTNLAVLKTDISNGNSNIMGLNSFLPNNAISPYYDHAIFGPTGNRVCRESSLTGGNNIRNWGGTNTTNVGVGFYFATAGRTVLQQPSNSEGFTEHNNLRNTVKSGTGNLPHTVEYNQNYIFGSQTSSRDETAVFQIWFNKMLNTAQTADLRSIIKTTIGKGLNLP